MLLPSGRTAAAAVIRGHDHRRLPAMRRVRLVGRPELGEEAVRAARRVEVLVVAAGVRPVIGLAERNVQHARPVACDGGERSLEGEVVITNVVPVAGDLFGDAVELG